MGRHKYAVENKAIPTGAASPSMGALLGFRGVKRVLEGVNRLSEEV